MERVFVVSAGSVNGAGLDIPSQWKCLSENGGPSFVDLREATTQWLPFGLDGLYANIGKALVCPVQMSNADLADRMELNVREFDRHQLFAYLAAMQAMDGVGDFDPLRFACVTATGGAGLTSISSSIRKLANGGRLGPRDNLRYLPNMTAGYQSVRYVLRGPSEVHGSACAASMHAIISLIRMIRCGEVDGGLVVGADAAISDFGIASFQGQRALGNGLSYQDGRSGFVMGEGAAAFWIVSEKALVQYGWQPVVEIAGYGASSDASQKGAITDPSSEGAAHVIRLALTMARLSLDDVSLVKTHGTATKTGDSSELDGLRLVDADAARTVDVVSLKTYIGHLLGAAGIAEAAIVLEMMKRGHVLPTRFLSHGNLADNCRQTRHVMAPVDKELNNVICNGFGFGGTNASIVFRRLMS